MIHLVVPKRRRFFAPRLPRRGLAVLLAPLAWCACDDARSHVHRSTPPARAVAPPAPVARPAVEVPVGASGPSASIVAVRRASTGAPAALDRVAEHVDVVTLVSRGVGSSARGPARIELRITGSIDTTLAIRIGSPVPIVISHAFRVTTGSGSGGLPDGRFQLRVRLLGPGGVRVAESVPVHVGVVSP